MGYKWPDDDSVLMSKVFQGYNIIWYFQGFIVSL
jgi:hypothetical protein